MPSAFQMRVEGEWHTIDRRLFLSVYTSSMRKGTFTLSGENEYGENGNVFHCMHYDLIPPKSADQP